ncbi:MAG: thiamine pyrophosphate-binding protein [Methanomicrobiales archaeon]
MLTTQYLLEAFRGEGITHMFLVPGGLIDPFLPVLAATDGITPIVTAHEAGAACMADGYARASGRFGVCFAIGGPGVTNMVTAVAAARTDSSPVMVISGQVPTDWEGRGGFQDSSPAALNDVAIFQPITISSLMVESPHLVHHHLRASLTKMLAGTKGPVHISLPTNIQSSEVLAPWAKLNESLYSPRFVDQHGIEQLWRVLSPPDNSPAPVRIVALAGAGVEKSGATADLVTFAERFEIPVATTLRAKGVFPEDHRLSLGIFGYAGHRPAIDAILSDEVEVLLVLGSGLSQRDTLFWDRKMLPSRALVQVDIDPQVIGRTFPADVGIVGDCGRVLQIMMTYDYELSLGLAAGNCKRQAWLENIRDAGPRCYEVGNTASDAAPLHPARVIKALRQAMPRDTVLVVDSGAHRAFCGHYWESYGPRSYISATNLGPMGWAIPAGIGAKLAHPERPLVVVTGDGCMLMHGMEIQTAARYGIAVIFLVINNGALGNVWLRAIKESPGAASLTEIPVHDWAGFARSLGLAASTVNKPGELAPAFQEAMAAGAPYLVDVRCDRRFTTPVTPFNQAKQAWVDDD